MRVTACIEIGISIPLASATPVRAFFVVSGGLAGVDAGFITAGAHVDAGSIGLPLLIRIDSLSAAMTRLVSVG